MQQFLRDQIDYKKRSAAGYEKISKDRFEYKLTEAIVTYGHSDPATPYGTFDPIVDHRHHPIFMRTDHHAKIKHAELGQIFWDQFKIQESTFSELWKVWENLPFSFYEEEEFKIEEKVIEEVKPDNKVEEKKDPDPAEILRITEMINNNNINLIARLAGEIGPDRVAEILREHVEKTSAQGTRCDPVVVASANCDLVPPGLTTLGSSSSSTAIVPPLPSSSSIAPEFQLNPDAMELDDAISEQKLFGQIDALGLEAPIFKGRSSEATPC